MAKGQKRSTREKKKPKQNKPKMAQAQASPLTAFTTVERKLPHPEHRKQH